MVDTTRTPEEELNLARWKRDGLLRDAEAMKMDESARLIYMERAVEAQKLVLQIRNQIVDTYTPCATCGRKVKSPCNDAEGYLSNGPWDFSCRDFFFPQNVQ